MKFNLRLSLLFSGFRSTGPFVIMIYTMIRGDLLRFCLIFFVFMAGFSQALHVLFVRIQCEGDFSTVVETFFRMFCVTLQQIADAYKNFYLHPNSGIQVIGKVISLHKRCREQLIEHPISDFIRHVYYYGVCSSGEYAYR